MSKKLKIVKYVVANMAIVGVVLTLLLFTVGGNATLASTENSPVYKGASSTKVSLMINVYWGTEYLQPMLKILEDNNVKTTFFVGGSWVEKNEAMLKQIDLAGHEIANHGYLHKDHKKLSEARNREEILVTHRLVKSIIAKEMTLFAPPSGAFNKITLEQADALGYQTIMWTRDTIDWRDHNTELIYNRATKKLDGGDLILMHPTQNTAEALDRIIKTVKAKGLNVATVSEVLAKD